MTELRDCIDMDTYGVVPKESLEIAWAAGLFEGEGCIALRRDTGSGRAYLRLQLMSSDQDVVERFRAAVGRGHVNGPYQRSPNNKPLWQCNLNSQDAREALKLLAPTSGSGALLACTKS